MAVLEYLAHERVVSAWATAEAPRYRPTMTGYSSKLPTRYMLRLDNGRRYRVYAMCYGNGSTSYVLVDGVVHHLTADTESLLERIGSHDAH